LSFHDAGLGQGRHEQASEFRVRYHKNNQHGKRNKKIEKAHFDPSNRVKTSKREAQRFFQEVPMKKAYRSSGEISYWGRSLKEKGGEGTPRKLLLIYNGAV